MQETIKVETHTHLVKSVLLIIHKQGQQSVMNHACKKAVIDVKQQLTLRLGVKQPRWQIYEFFKVYNSIL